MTKPILYSALGCGSAIVEAMYAFCGLEAPEIRDLDYEREVVAGKGVLREFNPISRVPTLVLPDGRPLTESGAIALYLHSRPGGGTLLPPADAPEYALALRMLFFLNSEVYPSFTYGDVPAEWVSAAPAQGELAASIRSYRCELWAVFEGWLSAEGPWALGRRASVIDLYLGVMTRWTPGTEWFEKFCPRIHTVAELARARAELVPVFARNFPK